MVDDAQGSGAAKLDTGDDPAAPAAAPAGSAEAIPPCCVATIGQHVRFNPMMVCAECKNIIKCFQEERDYANYIKFCRSRRRPVLTGQVQSYWTVAFRSYDRGRRG
jgi:hypothetical protein